MMRVLAAAIALMLIIPASARAEDDRWFARDKALHASAGAVLGAGGYGLGSVVFDSHNSRFASGLAAGLGAGAAKEWWDRSHGGDPSWRDFAWDGVGAAAGATVAWLVDRVVHGHRAPPPTSPARSAQHEPRREAAHDEGVMLPAGR